MKKKLSNNGILNNSSSSCFVSTSRRTLTDHFCCPPHPPRNFFFRQCLFTPLRKQWLANSCRTGVGLGPGGGGGLRVRGSKIIWSNCFPSVYHKLWQSWSKFLLGAITSVYFGSRAFALTFICGQSVSVPGCPSLCFSAKAGLCCCNLFTPVLFCRLLSSKPISEAQECLKSRRGASDMFWQKWVLLPKLCSLYFCCCWCSSCCSPAQAKASFSSLASNSININFGNKFGRPFQARILVASKRALADASQFKELIEHLLSC